jgi:hypothetical protein
VHPAAYIARFQPCLWLLPPPLPVVSPSIHPIWPAVVETQRATDRPTDQKPTSNCCGILPFPLPSLTPLSYFLHNSIVRGCSSFSTPPTHVRYPSSLSWHWQFPLYRARSQEETCAQRLRLSPVPPTNLLIWAPVCIPALLRRSSALFYIFVCTGAGRRIASVTRGAIQLCLVFWGALASCAARRPPSCCYRPGRDRKS